MSFDNVIEVEIEYFEWLYNYVCKRKANKNISYRKLFTYLHNTEFIFSIRRDMDRARNGIDLRYRFALSVDTKYPARDILDILDKPCSVLEMMASLAIKCEETIMDNTDYGDRTTQWFWNMMYNLGISDLTDDNFDQDYLEERITIFLNREYEPDGKGGLFRIRGCEEDLREVDIWTQLCWYLNDYT